MTRLALHHDAIATVKSGHLLFMRAGAGQSVRGQSLGPITVYRTDGSAHHYSAPSRDTHYHSVTADWHDLGQALTRTVTVGTHTHAKPLRAVFPAQTQAREATMAAYRRLRRAAATSI